jgi:ABC-type multidrug transport system fused ATPase/permease subunit
VNQDQNEDYRPIRRSDWRLLWNLWPITKPFRLTLFLGALMIVAASLVSMALPYLTKVAIDGYILPLGRTVTVNDPAALAEFFQGEARPQDILPSGRAGLYYLPANVAARLDPKEERLMVEKGVLSVDRYYFREFDPEGDFDYEAGAQMALASPGRVNLYPNLISVSERDLPFVPDSWGLVLRSADLRGLKILAILFGALMVLGYFFELGQRVILEIASQRLGHNLREKILAHLFGLSQAFFDRQEAGRLTSRLTSDVNNINTLVKSTAASFFSDLLSLLGVIAVMFLLSPRLALIALILTPIVVVISLYFSALARRQQRELRGKISAINQYFSETRAGIAIIKAFRGEKNSAQAFGKLNHENYLVGRRQLHSLAIFLPLVDFVATLALALILWFGGLLVLENAVSLGVLAAFVGYSNRFFNPIKDLAEKVNTFQSAFASLERLNALLDENERVEPQAPVLDPVSPGGEIEFKGVSFRYGEDKPLVLADVSFKIQRGETVALVGETGSGKSSLISLLLRFYDPTQGEIIFDSRPLKRLNLEKHRHRVALVTQDVYLYSGTVMDNLKLGRQDISDEEARRAAETVGASVFIERLPLQYREKLGSEGKSLSAGERQLLACARALIEAPEFVILDEATAFVDSESELLISRAMNTIFEGRTSIIIAHRLSTIKMANRILVLKKGRIVEEGAHAELIGLKGAYYRLALLQGLAQKGSLEEALASL